MRHLYISPWSEQRLLAFAKKADHEKAIEDAFEQFKQPSRPYSLGDYRKAVDTISQQAALDVKTAAPTWTRQIRRFLGSNIAGAVGIKVYDAERAEVNDSIERTTAQRTSAAESQMDLTHSRALRKIGERARKSVNSYSFLDEKSKVCAENITRLQAKEKEVSTRLADAEKNGAADMVKLEKDLEKLQQRIAVIESIKADVIEKIGRTNQADTIHQIEEADKYFREIFTLYRPESLFKLTKMIEEYALDADNRSSTQLARELEKIVKQMFPKDSGKQAQQLRLMLNNARAFLGDSRWERIANSVVYAGIPSVVAGSAAGAAGLALGGTLVGLGTGGIGLGVGLGVGVAGRAAYNYYQYRTLTKSDSHKNQVASYFNGTPARILESVADIQKEEKVSDRLQKLTKLAAGGRIQVLLGGAPLDLTIVGSRGDVVFATDKSGKRYSFDTVGFGKKFYFSFEKLGGGFEHKEIKATPDHLFSIV